MAQAWLGVDDGEMTGGGERWWPGSATGGGDCSCGERDHYSALASDDRRRVMTLQTASRPHHQPTSRVLASFEMVARCPALRRSEVSAY